LAIGTPHRLPGHRLPSVRARLPAKSLKGFSLAAWIGLTGLLERLPEGSKFLTDCDPIPLVQARRPPQRNHPAAIGR
jgi:hypothetical protein